MRSSPKSDPPASAGRLLEKIAAGREAAYRPELCRSLAMGALTDSTGTRGGSWVTSADPAFLRILARSEKYKLHYDAAKQVVPRVEVH